MRAKSVCGKVILVLCIASFLAGSLFTNRTWTRMSDSKGGISHHVDEKLSLVGADCDHKRKLAEVSSLDGEFEKTNQAIQLPNAPEVEIFFHNQGGNVSNQKAIVQPKEDDLIGLCREKKVKEAIELLEEGVHVDGTCFSLLFELCGNSKKLEDAKKVNDYFLRSTFRRC